MTEPLILPLDSPLATLGVAGGKGANLSRLIRGGFPVPAGIIVTTAAYDSFVDLNVLRPILASVVAGLTPENPAALEAASDTIRRQFQAGRLPEELANALDASYSRQFGRSGPVAVRSSATAEDLPDLSFAGQQDTYLNISGPDAVRDAVVRCWSSLWTARAIGYRARNDIPQESVSLAVVVQAMIQAEAAGVLFTANPLNGRRSECAIDATLGLGEALVSGQIEPDHYVVDMTGPCIIEKRLGAKTPLGEAAPADRRSVQALPDHAILDLARLGANVAANFGTPQDIEWTWSGGELALVQSRPITSLYPLPSGTGSAQDLRVLASFGAFQGVLGPLTPLGIDALRSAAAAAGRLLGYDATWESQGALRIAGERLFIDLTALLRNGFGRSLLRGALGQVEPGTGEAMREVWDDPRVAATAERPSPRLMRHIVPLLLPLVPRAIGSVLRPEKAEKKAEEGVALSIEYYRRLADGAQTLEQRLALLDESATAIRKFLLPYLFPRFVPGMFALNRLYRLADELPAGRSLALEVLRGLPHNVTTEMDLALWDTARRIRQDPASAAAFSGTESRALARDYLENRLPAAAQGALNAFLESYGMRGLVEIDLGRARWRDDPAPVVEALQSYLQIADPDLAPDAVFARGALSAQQAIDRLSSELGKLKGGRRKAAQARWAARRVRALAGLRESPKFTIVNLLGIAREAFLASGAELVAAGLLQDREDILFLSRSELDALARAQERGEDLEPWGHRLQASVTEHRARYARELRRRQVPRLLLSDGTAFYEGVGGKGEPDGSASHILPGSPVSPGVVEGAVRVVLNPAGAQLQPGEILVCPGTDPSWTPLFLAAAGLVMEVGGLMTHGSVVAREYGIPAVVGVTNATERLRTGQRIRLDGFQGRITVLDESPSGG